MKPRVAKSVGCAIALLLTSVTAAQGPPAPRASYKPPVNPYLNLLQTNQDRAFLYQGIIRPQIEDQRFQEQQRRELERINSQARVQAATTLDAIGRQQKEIDQIQRGPVRRTTGHPTAFLSRNKFFPRLKR